MDFLLWSILFSPGIAGVLVYVIYTILRLSKKPMADSIVLVYSFFMGGIILASITFVVVMIWSEVADANLGPLGYFLMYGPLSFALGSLVGFAKFTTLKPKDNNPLS